MTAAPATKTVDLDRPRDALAQLGLAHAAEQLGDVVSEAVKANWAPHVFLDARFGRRGGGRVLCRDLLRGVSARGSGWSC